ncbi:hypothetical protein BNATCHR364 (nucleomorph) [Bigelowiella natans]|uniref:TRASH domain-containing protein n=1 Tax=Bigelowiella natans TaxID=227086 RepID=Q3LVZ8_BIGNA|nr:hypothetical protein BNATCHR364 [Bigelowiella natans]ABA27368.1 hypothetical protein [Bigelowiella natans]|mmetsp:Transcript_16320/g.19559  ORF Transcript_16320/g.19559 Transcript_16320/m.19559 type:complete len:107 (+) Transcript_16320:42-362(+)
MVKDNCSYCKNKIKHNNIMIFKNNYICLVFCRSKCRNNFLKNPKSLKCSFKMLAHTLNKVQAHTFFKKDIIKCFLNFKKLPSLKHFSLFYTKWISLTKLHSYNFNK